MKELFVGARTSSVEYENSDLSFPGNFFLARSYWVCSWQIWSRNRKGSPWLKWEQTFTLIGNQTDKNRCRFTLPDRNGIWMYPVIVGSFLSQSLLYLLKSSWNNYVKLVERNVSKDTRRSRSSKYYWHYSLPPSHKLFRPSIQKCLLQLGYITSQFHYFLFTAHHINWRQWQTMQHQKVKFYCCSFLDDIKW